jgi:putative phosphoesterase
MMRRGAAARIGVISDTHLPRGSRILPRECAEELRRSDAILHAGDLTSLSFLEELHSFLRPVYAIHGNADEKALQELLPPELVVTFGEIRIGLVHDAGPRHGRKDRLLGRFPGCDGVLYGHTHVPEVDRHEGMWILNPGSPTERRRGPYRSMMLLEVGPGKEIQPELLRLT